MEVKVEKILEQIWELDSADELRTINEAVVERLKMLRNIGNSLAKSQFRVGAKVVWDSNRRGYGVQSGVVIKKNRSRAVVRSESGVEWTVPFNMLREAEDEAV